MSRPVILNHVRTAVRIVLYASIGTVTVAGTGFAGTHYYLESKDPTPSTWSQKARFAYRAAVLNHEYLGQSGAALVDLQTAIDSVNSDSSSSPSLSPLKATDEGIAKALIMAGNILKKQGDLDSAMSRYLEALPHASFNAQLQSDAARRLGEIQAHLGRVLEAQQSLELAVQSVLPHHRTGTLAIQLDTKIKYTPELLSSVKSLALFRAQHQGKFKPALATLLSLLQYQQQHPATQSQTCEAAATMANIAELVWALGHKQECRRWTDKSLDLCTNTSKRNDKYCLECAGINHNMLGLLKLKEGDQKSARAEFGRAMIYAERAEDGPGQEQYSENIYRCVE